jgi:hypothetical protein
MSRWTHCDKCLRGLKRKKLMARRLRKKTLRQEQAQPK